MLWREGARHRDREFEQLLGHGLGDLVEAGRGGDAAIKGLVQHEVQRMDARHLIAVDTGAGPFREGMAEPGGDGIRRKRRADIGQVFVLRAMMPTLNRSPLSPLRP